MHELKFILLGSIVFAFFLSSCSDNCDKTDTLPCDCLEEPIFIDMSEFEIVKVKQKQAVLAIEIDDEEVELVNELGFIWGGEDSLTLETSAIDSAIADSVIEDYSGLISALEPSTNYFVRAYAKTDDGTSYSGILTFLTISANGTKGTVTDTDGNTYNTMIIGGKEWMLENLKVTHYRDGSPIKTDISARSWGVIRYGAYGIYPFDNIEAFESDSAVVDAYGLHYNWYAVNDERGISPEGWHVPTDDEWRELEMSLGMSEAQSLDTDMRGSDQGYKMKIQATWPKPHPRWDAGNKSSNSSGMSIIPGGARYEGNGSFGYKGFFANLWTATEVGTSNAWGRSFVFSEGKIGRNIEDKNHGFNVRCVRDGY